MYAAVVVGRQRGTETELAQIELIKNFATKGDAMELQADLAEAELLLEKMRRERAGDAQIAARLNIQAVLPPSPRVAAEFSSPAPLVPESSGLTSVDAIRQVSNLAVQLSTRMCAPPCAPHCSSC